MFNRFFKVTAPVALAGSLLVGAAAQAFADPRDFTLENDSLSYIAELHVSPTTSDYWGPDILKRDVAPGRSVDISFDPTIGSTCIYDLLVVTSDGTQTEKYNQNLCTTETEYYSES